MIILGSDQENKLLAKGGNYMELSIQIKKYRTELHLSQEELAEKVYVTRQTISNWENEKSYPDIHSLLLLSSLFNVSLDQLIKGDIEKMKEIISEQEIKKFNYYGSIYTVHLAVLIISAVPLFMWLGRYAYIPFGILFITEYWALKVEKLKKKNDIQTYKEIVAFTEGKKLDELQKKNNVLLRKYNGDAKFARVHKRIREENLARKAANKQPIVSEYDASIMDVLKSIKSDIDQKVYDRNDILKKDAYFERTVMTQIKAGIDKLGIASAREDRVFIQSRITKQYLDQYNQTYSVA